MKLVRRGIFDIILLGVLFGALSVYLNMFTSSPRGVVEQFYEAYNSSDINGMVACMEPGTEQIVSGGVDLTSSILGAITGVDLDLSALIDIMPLFADTSFDNTEQILIQNVHVVSYTPAFAPEITEPLIEIMPELVNILAEDAVVEFQIQGTDVIGQLEVSYYGNDGWRISLDSEMFSEN